MNNPYIWILIFFVLGMLVTILKPIVKGWLGEKTVSVILSRLPEEYIIINNVMLPSIKKTTQIDHIVVSPFGIFVIETKNYKGWITGGENSDQWTKNMYGKKYSFKNPLHQNYGHVKTLQTLLDLPEDSFISIVAFSTDATIKVKTQKNVIYMKDVNTIIKSYKNRKFEADEVKRYATQIIEANIDSKENRKEHVKSIHTNVQNDRILVQQGTCPKCGGKLVERKGRYGMFTGCSNYPKCRYTVKK